MVLSMARALLVVGVKYPFVDSHLTEPSVHARSCQLFLGIRFWRRHFIFVFFFQHTRICRVLCFESKLAAGIEGRQEVRGRLFIRVLAPNSQPSLQTPPPAQPSNRPTTLPNRPSSPSRPLQRPHDRNDDDYDTLIIIVLVCVCCLCLCPPPPCSRREML